MTEDFRPTLVAAARGRVERARAARPLPRPRAPRGGPSFLGALRAASAGGLAIVAEVKRRSPSRGDIAAALDAAELARAYAAAGASAVSVLTEPERFGGSLNDLRAAAGACDLPVLRKDFIVDEYQLWEAHAAGAAAVLLIAAALDSDRLAWLHDEAGELGLDVLVEIHDERDIAAVNELGCPLVGVNNRDLVTLEVDVATTTRLTPLLHSGCLVVAESGIATAADAASVRAAGAHAALVGEALVRAAADGTLDGLLAALRSPSAPAAPTAAHSPVGGDAARAVP
jgi:indole-3-glycerol phosphate synthase